MVPAPRPEAIGSRACEHVEISVIDRAEAHLIVTYGAGWRNKVHRTHCLSLAEPVLYCRSCGRSSDVAGTLRGLRERCPGHDDSNATGKKRANRASSARHPRAPTQLLKDPVPVDAGRAR